MEFLPTGLGESPPVGYSLLDGQNLDHAARHAFGYTFPDFDPVALAAAISKAQGPISSPTSADEAPRSTPVLVCRNKVIRLPDGTEHSYLSGEEKGIDIRIAIDVIGLDWIG